MLIPKLKSPKSITEFLAIRLCNVMYKIITKVMANRMKSVLLNMIRLSQSTFVLGKMIGDSIMATIEFNHSMRIRRNDFQGFVSFKVDMKKAYD